jgi:hypothetical protein
MRSISKTIHRLVELTDPRFLICESVDETVCTSSFGKVEGSSRTPFVPAIVSSRSSIKLLTDSSILTRQSLQLLQCARKRIIQICAIDYQTLSVSCSIPIDSALPCQRRPIFHLNVLDLRYRSILLERKNDL